MSFTKPIFHEINNKDNNSNLIKLINLINSFDHIAEDHEKLEGEMLHLIKTIPDSVFMLTAEDDIIRQSRLMHTLVRHNMQETLKSLASKKIPINDLDEHLHTPIWQAVYTNNAEMVEILIGLGANIKNDHLLSLDHILIEAMEYCDLAIVSALFEAGAQYEYETPEGEWMNGYKIALEKQKKDIAHDFIEKLGIQHRSHGKTFLHYAAQLGDVDEIEYLLSLGLDINSIDEYGGFTPLQISTHFRQVYAAFYLMEHGADINIKDLHGNTIGHFAAYLGEIYVFQKYLELGGDINTTNYLGITPLFLALENKQTETVEYLLQRGANPSICDNSNNYPIIYAINNDYSLGVIESIYSYHKDFEKPFHIESALLLASKGNIRVARNILNKHLSALGYKFPHENDFEYTALEYFTLKGEMDIVTTLIQKLNMNINATNRFSINFVDPVYLGKTLIQSLRIAGKEQEAKLLLDIGISHFDFTQNYFSIRTLLDSYSNCYTSFEQIFNYIAYSKQSIYTEITSSEFAHSLLVRENKFQIFAKLLQYGQMSIHPLLAYKYLFEAIDHKDNNLVALMLQIETNPFVNPTNPSISPIQYSVSVGNYEAFTLMLSKTKALVNLELIDYIGYYLSFLSKDNQSPFIDFFKLYINDRELIECALKFGINIPPDEDAYISDLTQEGTGEILETQALLISGAQGLEVNSA